LEPVWPSPSSAISVRTVVTIDLVIGFAPQKALRCLSRCTQIGADCTSASDRT
jgi:hypothetical protein